jgi:pyruvate,water dikinase
VADSWGPSLHVLAGERRVAVAQARARPPAPFLGPPPDPDAQIPAAVAKFYGVPGSGGVEGDVVRGTGASAGGAVGVARVVQGREEFARLGGGDVLVCVTTTPAWTPLFGSLGGLVTDTGGILCHAAVVAREYGLPAVVGTGVGTRAIPDGAHVEVDGTTGEVRILTGAFPTGAGAGSAGKGGTDGSR